MAFTDDYQRGLDAGANAAIEGINSAFPFTVFKFYGLPGDERERSDMWEACAKFKTREEAAAYMKLVSKNDPRTTYKIEEAKSVRAQAKPTRSAQGKKPRSPKL